MTERFLPPKSNASVARLEWTNQSRRAHGTLENKVNDLASRKRARANPVQLEAETRPPVPFARELSTVILAKNRILVGMQRILHLRHQ